MDQARHPRFAVQSYSVLVQNGSLSEFVKVDCEKPVSVSH